MKAILGLGNPGTQYSDNRHNAGALFIDALAERELIKVKKSGFFSLYGIGRIGETESILVKPQTYMNLSGGAAMAIMNYYSLVPSDLIIVHDDLDIPLGKVKTKIGGGDGGHNGLRSIVSSLKSKEFHRIRIGIGRPPQGMDSADYVLSRFNKSELNELQGSIFDALDILDTLLK